MQCEEIITELETVVGKANVKLCEITEGKMEFSDVIITYVPVGDDIQVNKGDGPLATICAGKDMFASYKKAKRAIWAVVDSTRDKLNPKPKDEESQPAAAKPESARTEQPSMPAKADKSADDGAGRFAVRSFEDMERELYFLVEKANRRLAEATKGGFPFTMEEVQMRWECDSVGIYVYSGNVPVAVGKRIGNTPASVFRDIKEAVWKTVDATRSTVERRKGIRDDAEKLKGASAKIEKAAEALRAAGLPTDLLESACDQEASAEIVRAVQATVRSANRGLFLYYGDACTAIYGSLAHARLSVSGFAGGIVVSVGGKPVLVSRFPKVGNVRTVEKTVDFLTTELETIAESRREYLAAVQRNIKTEAKLREAAKKIADAEDDVRHSAAL